MRCRRQRASSGRALTALLASIGADDAPWDGQIARVRRWYEPQLERLYEPPQARRGDLDQLERLAMQYATREAFVTELTLDPPQASGDLAGDPLLDEDYLVLSTVHSAKGQEWESVHVLNVTDGSFPSEFATGRAESIEEERRLLYVAMTRARSELQLIAPVRFYVTQQAAVSATGTCTAHAAGSSPNRCSASSSRAGPRAPRPIRRMPRPRGWPADRRCAPLRAHVVEPASDVGAQDLHPARAGNSQDHGLRPQRGRAIPWLSRSPRSRLAPQPREAYQRRWPPPPPPPP